MQPWEQIDLPAKVKSVRRKTRPWKSIIALLLAIAAAIVSDQLKLVARLGLHSGFFANAKLSHIAAYLLWVAATIAFLVCGSIATYSLATKARQILEPKAGTSHSAVTRYAILIIGAFTTLVVTLQLFGVPIGQLVLGGALTSVFVGIAAQQALGNVFAGLVLLFARPFRVGDEIRLRSGALSGEIAGVVTDIGITYVRLHSSGSVISVPNSQVLNAVVGPVPPLVEARDDAEGREVPVATSPPGSASVPANASASANASIPGSAVSDGRATPPA